jgi:hypothetical protein
MEINGEIVIGIADVEEEKEGYFSYNGCSNCGNNLGNNVQDTLVYTEKTGWKDHYEMQFCHSCLCAYHNGDDLDESCKNIFKI